MQRVVLILFFDKVGLGPYVFTKVQRITCLYGPIVIVLEPYVFIKVQKNNLSYKQIGRENPRF